MKPSDKHPFMAGLTSILLLVGTIGILPDAVQGQLTINPTILFADEQQPVQNLTLTNHTRQRLEVYLDYSFGYPQTDETGALSMNYSDSVLAARHGLQEQLRIFPKRFTLSPDERRIVQVQVVPAGERSDGLYWERLRITSNEVTDDVGLDDQQQSTTTILYRVQQNIGFFYRVGTATTGITMGSQIQTVRTDSLLRVTLDLKQSGNSPYMGSYQMRLMNAENVAVYTQERTLAVYFGRVLRLDIPTTDLPQGRYRLDINFETTRGDILPRDIVGAPSELRSWTLELRDP